MRKPFVAANWKMHKTVAEAVEYAGAFNDHMAAGGRAAMRAYLTRGRHLSTPDVLDNDARVYINPIGTMPFMGCHCVAV